MRNRFEQDISICRRGILCHSEELRNLFNKPSSDFFVTRLLYVEVFGGVHAAIGREKRNRCAGRFLIDPSVLRDDRVVVGGFSLYLW